MKNILYFLILIPLLIMGQTPNTNNVKTTVYKAPYQTVPANSLQAEEINYFDGLGRPIQNVKIKAGGNGEDIITPIEYDLFGRSVKEFLPYAALQSAPEIGQFRTDAVNGVHDFYNKKKYEETRNPYSEKRFENSPLNTIKEQGSPGSSWMLEHYENTAANYFFMQIIYQAFDTTICQSLIPMLSVPQPWLIIEVKNNILKFSFYHHPGNVWGDNTGCIMEMNPVLLENQIGDPMVLPDIDLGEIKDRDGNSTGYKAIIQNNYFQIKPVIDGVFPLVKLFDTVNTVNLTPFLTTVDRHTIKYDYYVNKFNEVRRFSIDFTAGNTENPKLLCNEDYESYSLYKTITKNENWIIADGSDNTIEEFTDKLGRTILKRTFNNGLSHDTNYVYDKYGNLTYVIPPLASDKIVTQNFISRHHAINIAWADVLVANPQSISLFKSFTQQTANQDLLNVDFYERFSAKGGMSVETDDTGKIVLHINITTASPMPYKPGLIVNLASRGFFENRELGRIQGSGYQYIFSIVNNAIVVTGSGNVPTIITSISNDASYLPATKNHPWTSICVTDAATIASYNSGIASLPNSQILNAYVANARGAKGGAAVNLSDDDKVTVSINITSTTAMALKTGVVIPITTARSIPDMELGTTSGTGYSYSFSIKNNALFIIGSGTVKNLNFFTSRYRIASYTVNNNALTLCYIYKYDSRNRVVEKYVPDNGWTHIVYDKLDRPILTQDETMRAQGKWLFTKFDVLGRTAYTGETLQVEGRSAIQLKYNNATYPTAYEQRTGLSNSFTHDGAKICYTNNVFPASGKILTVNYYDDIDFETKINIIDNSGVMPGNTYVNFTTRLKGLPTGGLVRVLENNEPNAGARGWITNFTAYDEQARPVWVYSTNSYLNAWHMIESKLDFTGKKLETKTQHKTGTNPKIVIYDYFTYDDADRPLQHTQSIGESPVAPKQLIALNKYDALGATERKSVGARITVLGTMPETPWQIIHYKQNIRGWLTGINDTIPNLSLANKMFSFKIDYLYNGNIAATSWKHRMDGDLRMYYYTYDDMNRLTSAVYKNMSDINEQFHEKDITYDKNGNILGLSRWGRNSSSNFGKIDQLTYSYQSLSNRLLSVTDNITGIDGFNDLNKGSNDYNYTVAGNLTKDLNKNITAIAYNYLNLPVKVVKDNTHTIEYVYDATGSKVEKKVLDGIGNITTTGYSYGFVYKNNQLEYFPHAEGYVAYTGNQNFEYVYQYKDHLGNVRVSYTNSPNGLVLRENNDYYPFGLRHTGGFTTSGNIAQKIKYQEQERQDELGLNWDSFKYRNYDFVIGRFMSVDPLAEDYVYNGVYNFAENKVIDHRELEGLEGVWFGLLGTNNAPPATSTIMNTARATIETGAKAAEVVEGTTTAAARLSQNASRGRATESEQLAKNGLEKNTESFTRTDPKTGKETTTIPDSFKRNGGTVEVKDVLKQSLTRQLRTQREISNESGVKPELIINQSAKLTKPLKNGGFDIKLYNNSTIISPPIKDNTNMKRPELPRPVQQPIKKEPVDLFYS